MKPSPDPRSFFLNRGMFILLASLFAPGPAFAEPATAAVSAFNSYVASVESRLARQHQSQVAFLASDLLHQDEKLLRGELIVEQLTPSAGNDLPGAMLHHGRGTAFAKRATAADFEHLMKDFSAYPQVFSPQVLRAKVLTSSPDHADDRFEALMRVSQRHVITVVMDTTYDISYGRLDSRHRYSVSRSTRISEIDSPGTDSERALDSRQEHGFLWRLNTYWSYEERDDGLYMQIESVSLTRSIPRGLGWAVRPFVESVPRESLEFTLRSTCNALRK